MQMLEQGGTPNDLADWHIWSWIIWLSGHMVYGFSVWGMLKLGKVSKEKR
ncbi:hypothetical protein GCM10011346_15190 [Oceanobacillus neutriphilus]|uniref:Uncharacterized protein n=1 Tax=Oceanobacillus neutriphilus TaxID=531815 RepID=A0ABQ2NR88_9BACI|nr:hypothetical protein GCM10011346_15190 [Oceanobacillus neutriphilus]